jgi:hypothetical protein
MCIIFAGCPFSKQRNVGDILPNSPGDERRGAATAEFDFMDEWYRIQVKQKDKVSRSDEKTRSNHGE